MHFKVVIYWTFACSIALNFMHFCREPTIMCMNNQRQTNLVIFYILRLLALFLGPSKAQVGSFKE